MPPSTSMRPAPIGSGSSVTSGRCCAAAGPASNADSEREVSESGNAHETSFQGVGRSGNRRLDGRAAVTADAGARRGVIVGRAVSAVVDGHCRPKLRRRIQAGVEQMPRRDVAQRLEHRLLDARMLDLEIHQQPLDPLALKAEIAAGRTAAADDRQLRFLGVRPRLVLADIDQRTNHHMRAVVGHQLGRHRLERAGEEEVQQQRLDEVVGVVAERDLGRADLLGDRGRARRGAAGRTASRASGRRRGCPRSARRCRCARCGIPSRAPRRFARSGRACIPCSRSRRSPRSARTAPARAAAGRRESAAAPSCPCRRTGRP